MSRNLKEFFDHLSGITPDQLQFHQAVEEVYSDVFPYIKDENEYWEARIPQRLVIPDRIIEFRVTWPDDNNDLQINRGWRVQHNNAIGPYKGGIRFLPDVSLDTFKFLAFEQTFKNGLTGLQMGGAKGGADFDPDSHSQGEVMRFCQAFMLELYKYIGPDTDIPAGDIGVSSREIGYLFGAYKKITDKFHGALTGKSPSFGGSCIRKEATGYGCVYFLEAALDHRSEDLAGKRCLVSGAGNVALHTAEKLIERDALVLTLSDSQGMIYAPDGLTPETLQDIIQVKVEEGGALADINWRSSDVKYSQNQEPWAFEGDIAIPAAVQNEIDGDKAKSLRENGVSIVCEAANMPLTKDARDFCRGNDILVLPSKAVNAGGVVVSNFERTQNSMKVSWDASKVDHRLKETMQSIHGLCLQHSEDSDYIKGANIAGFKVVADAMLAYGSS